MTRSLTASTKGIQLAKQKLIGKGWNQKNLIGFVCESRQPISNFFNGKPVDRSIFVSICNKLSLDWQKIADLPNLDVQVIRDKVRADIQHRCGTMQVLDMTQPIVLDEIYTTVNILETITGRRRLGINKLLENCTPEMSDRIGLGRITEKRIPGPEAVNKYPKLMVWGKPGAGKTTFLKYLAIQCAVGQLQQGKIPIFITLKDFTYFTNSCYPRPNLLEYINQQLAKCKVAKTESAELCEQGKALILLDGLDEVIQGYSYSVINQIQQFSDQYRDNSIVITCRIAAKEYTFQGFTEVEVADFDKQQIQTFAQKWFQQKDPVKAERFIEKLEYNKQIQELATNPLLLTLLCLVFGETADFPSNRSELYKEGVDVLLKKWDAKRNIERNVVYRKLSVIRKEDLLSQVAWTTFESGDYFFKQRKVEGYIADYIRNLPDAKTDPEALQLDSEKILKSIEAQHGLLVERAKGIYSFSHLTFQEYFTARKIVSDPQVLEQVLQCLVERITETRWREVFLLVVGMLPRADCLLHLMKHQVNRLAATDKKLQQLLGWVQEKSKSVVGNYKLAAIRAFYFSHALNLDLNLSRALDLDFDLDVCLNRALDFDLDLNLNRALDCALNLSFNLNFNLDLNLNRALDCALNLSLDLDPELKKALQLFRNQLPRRDNKTKFKQWWHTNGQAWTEQLRVVMIEYRNIGHKRQFSHNQKKLLNQYYDANKLLVDCLNSDCYVSREVRQEIEDTLLLPIAQIRQHQQKSQR